MNHRPPEPSSTTGSADIKITGPQEPERRLWSPLPPGLQRRKPDGDIPDVDPDVPPGDPPVEPSTSVWPPELAFVFSPAVFPAGSPAMDAFRDSIRGSRLFGPSADVRPLSVQETLEGGTRAVPVLKIGIWSFGTVPNSVDSQARDRALASLRLLSEVPRLRDTDQSRNIFAVFISSALIHRVALAEFNRLGGRIDDNGRPNPSGNIHLNSLSVSFQEGNLVETRVTGFDDRSWPAANFELVIKDTLSISARVVVNASDVKLNVDPSGFFILAALSLMTGGVFGALSVLLTAGFVGEAIVASGIPPPAGVTGGAGSAVVRALPTQRRLTTITANGKVTAIKIVFLYTSLAVGPGGVVASGTFLLPFAEPSVTILGPIQIAVDPGTSSVKRSYSIAAQDLERPLQLTWQVDGVNVPGQDTVLLDFDITGTEPGGMVAKQVSVQATDNDGLTANDQATVEIHVARDDQDDPICRLKPWLPQCQP